MHCENVLSLYLFKKTFLPNFTFSRVNYYVCVYVCVAYRSNINRFNTTFNSRLIISTQNFEYTHVRFYKLNIKIPSFYISFPSF